jgi:hypothetical protein
LSSRIHKGMADRLYHYTNEQRIYAFDFSEMEELVGGDTLVSAVVTSSPSGLTIGSPSVDGSKIEFQVTGGTAHTVYSISCLATTSSGAKILGKGDLLTV